MSTAAARAEAAKLPARRHAARQAPVRHLRQRWVRAVLSAGRKLAGMHAHGLAHAHFVNALRDLLCDLYWLRNSMPAKDQTPCGAGDRSEHIVVTFDNACITIFHTACLWRLSRQRTCAKALHAALRAFSVFALKPPQHEPCFGLKSLHHSQHCRRGTQEKPDRAHALPSLPHPPLPGA